MECLSCGDELQSSGVGDVYRENDWIKRDIISAESGTKGMKQPAAKYNCQTCGEEYDTKFFTLKNQPGGGEDPKKVPEICQEHQILALGYGGTPISEADSDPSNAVEMAKILDDHFDGKVRMDDRDFVIWMDEGDFVFTYDSHQNPTKYFQTRVTGKVQTPHDPDATLHGEPLDEQTKEEFLRQHINLYREATWKQIPKDKLPGPLHRDVPIKNGTIRKIKSNVTANVAHNAVRLWDDNLEADFNFEDLQRAVSDSVPEEVVSCLNETEIEEVVSSLLQDKEQATIQLNTAVASQPDTEAILRTSHDGKPHTIYFQVKSNSDPSTLGDLGKKNNETLYVYAGGQEGEIVHAKYISNEETHRYLQKNLAKVPPTIRDTLNRQLRD